MRIEPIKGIRVYTNQRHYIALQEIESSDDEHGDVVEIHPDNVDAVIEGIRREKAEFLSLGLIPGAPDHEEEAAS